MESVAAAADVGGSPWPAKAGEAADKGGGGGSAGTGPGAGSGTAPDASAGAAGPAPNAPPPSISAADEARPPPSARVSRWSDGPPASGTEPPSKKPRSDPPAAQDATDKPVAAYGTGADPADGPPGLSTDGSAAAHPAVVAGVNSNPSNPSYAPAATATAAAAAAVAAATPAPAPVTAQTYTYSGSQSYGPGYSHTPSYGSGSSFAPGSAKGTGSLFYKTKLCNNFKSGSCTFNERCHFAHGVEEIRKPPPGWESMVASGVMTGASGGRSTGPPMGGQPRKMKMCRFYVDGNCPYGDRCNFLHSSEEGQRSSGLDPRGVPRAPGTTWQNYKTRLCAKWESGETCEFGDKCHFAHGHEELQRYIGAASYPNGGTTIPDVQQSTYNPMMQPSPLAAPYAPPVSYPNTGVPMTNPTPNTYSYPNPGTAAQQFTGSQDAANGVSANYSYWGPSTTPVQPLMASQGYSQPNQATPWATGYSGDGGYLARDNTTSMSQYPQQPQNLPYVDTTSQYNQQQQYPQQQPQYAQQQPQYAQQQPQPQQQQTVPYPSGGSVGGYQDVTPTVNSSYPQSETNVGYYQGSYSETNYPSQQADYNARYPVA